MNDYDPVKGAAQNKVQIETFGKSESEKRCIERKIMKDFGFKASYSGSSGTIPYISQMDQWNAIHTSMITGQETEDILDRQLESRGYKKTWE